MQEFFSTLARDFHTAFIEDNRWKYILEGIQNTLILTFLALIVGVVLGVIIAAVRSTYDRQYVHMTGPGKIFLAIGNWICKVYLTVIRGT
ncbi:MAG: amino acid ABC transporter permease, partial [Clostridia bacterium]|nr:amino acid ABC transporter permease [Clostridia bacterium]